MLSAAGVFAGIFIQGYQLDNIDFSHGLKGIFDIYPIFNAEGNSGVGTKFIPVFFVTVACGITSGFHSTQCTLIGRSVRHEKEGKMVFYGMMILEGLIAMIWAAAAMGLYNSGSTAGAIGSVGEVAKGLLGPIGGIVAILGVIVLPITSGDTALRSCRLMVADYLHIDQKTRKNRVMVTLGIFIPVIFTLIFAKMNAEGFNILWRYFALEHETIGVFAFAAITVYLMAKKGAKKGVFLVAFFREVLYVHYLFFYFESEDWIWSFYDSVIFDCWYSDSTIFCGFDHIRQKIRIKTPGRIKRKVSSRNVCIDKKVLDGTFYFAENIPLLVTFVVN